tara:strand:- start:379 stop:972 length:594 start_codon:yes stop_codon:yes gene_type:complete
MVLFSIYFFGLITQTVWLGWVAEFLILKQDFKNVDLLVVSTGSYERFRYAVKIVREQKAEKLLLLGDNRIKSPIREISILDIAFAEALELGLSSDNIVVRESTSTLVDARVTRKVLKDLDYRSVGIVSDIYNMRRLRLVFDRILNDRRFDIIYLFPAGKWARFHPNRWWEYPYEFEYVLKELIKIPLDYYRLEFLIK